MNIKQSAIEQARKLVKASYGIDVRDEDLKSFVKYITIVNIDMNKYDITMIYKWLNES